MTDLTYPIKVLEDALEYETESLSRANKGEIGCFDMKLLAKYAESRKIAKERIPQLEAAIKLLKEAGETKTTKTPHCNHSYSRTMDQPYPRRCTKCGKKEKPTNQ